MQTVYNLLETLLPFSWIHYEFMKNALIAVLIITPLFGIVGTMIVNNKMSFFSDALGHSALTGIAIGSLLGIADTDLSMILFAVIFSLLLNKIKNANLISTDTVISVFSSLGIAVGLAILSQGGNFSKYSNLLIGDILSIKPSEITFITCVFVITISFWFVFFNQLHAMSVNKSLAESKGIPTKLLDNLFVVLTAVIVMLSIKWVGILIINALLILPAASSRNISSNMREYHLYSVIFSLFSGVSGLIFSYYNTVATGPMIVIVASIIFFATYLIRKRVK